MLLGLDTFEPRDPAELLDPGLLDLLERLDVRSLPTASARQAGEREGKRRGQAVEFEDFRPYAAGDSLRLVDWPVYARLGRLVVRIFREEEDLTVHVLLDATRSMRAGKPCKLRLAARLAVALGSMASLGRNRTMLTTFDGANAPTRAGPFRGRPGIRQIARAVFEGLTKSSGSERFTDPIERPIAGAARAIRGVERGRAVVILITDGLEDGQVRDTLGWLAASRSVEPVLIEVLSPQELDPAEAERAGLVGDLEATDAESGAAVGLTLSSSRLREAFARLGAKRTDLGTFCRSRGIQRLSVSSDADLVEVLQTDLVRGMVLQRRS